MPKRAILSEVDDIVQVRQAFDDFMNYCGQLGWTQEEVIWWLSGMCNKLMEVE